MSMLGCAAADVEMSMLGRYVDVSGYVDVGRYVDVDNRECRMSVVTLSSHYSSPLN